jgi:alkylhydroperoxidase family enzyme
MSRITPPPDVTLPPAIRQLFADETRQHGAPLNTTKVWARHPALLEAYRAFGNAMRGTSLIPPALRYLVYVRVASLNGCPF